MASADDYFHGLKQRANKGESLWEWMIGISYMSGVDTKRDVHKGLYWLKKAADKDYPRAHISLGQCYGHGWEAMKDLHQAIRCFRKAAKSKLCSTSAKGWLELVLSEKRKIH
ncbi:hypothetical protein G9A89_004431 [Geosiphon pyriformis]|nr:hypothetical protein G9A89_004431 [Geosiphon pyriformis]